MRLVSARPPTDHELQLLQDGFRTNREYFQKHSEAARALLSMGSTPRDSTLEATTHAAWTQVARMLLNLDEAITKE